MGWFPWNPEMVEDPAGPAPLLLTGQPAKWASLSNATGRGPNSCACHLPAPIKRPHTWRFSAPGLCVARNWWPAGDASGANLPCFAQAQTTR